MGDREGHRHPQRAAPDHQAPREPKERPADFAERLQLLPHLGVQPQRPPPPRERLGILIEGGEDDGCSGPQLGRGEGRGLPHRRDARRPRPRLPGWRADGGHRRAGGHREGREHRPQGCGEGAGEGDGEDDGRRGPHGGQGATSGEPDVAGGVGPGLRGGWRPRLPRRLQSRRPGPGGALRHLPHARRGVVLVVHERRVRGHVPEHLVVH
mmetsp:Transcript_132137/g.422774  ORF Transcript_132137/g.422774 Transcript_132137/m.422774 type:complete len:210 (-) Transcript_132137:3389-4018(-)